MVSEIITKSPYIRGIPIVDAKGEIKSIAFTDRKSVKKQTRIGIPVVIMAGGKGSRLAPYTEVLPKPLLPVGDKTITEHIISRFIDYGCDDFIMIINHKKELIKAYFSESPSKGNLRFIEETVFQGTGGGLELLKGTIDRTFFMTNCDILIEADYEDLLKHHKNSGALLTMVCALKKVSVPYGTVVLDDDGKPERLIEKPEYPLLTNTGLYVIETSFLDIIPAGAFIHITDLIQQLIDKGENIGVYPISENGWFDMGQPDEMKRMQEGIGF
jgi:NDP-sugar pyrophosphorylase family protein